MWIFGENGGRFNFFDDHDDDDDDDQNDSYEFDQVDKFRGSLSPWPFPVEGAELLDEISASFSDHVVITPHGSAACALWAVHTYCYSVFEHSPRLFIRSPTRRCGKTTLLDLCEKLVHRPLATSDATGAALLRFIESQHPTLLCDEHDSMPYNKDLRNIFNSGFKSGKVTLRADRAYQTFGPFALASNARLHPTMEDRCIIILMKRKLPTEKLKPLRDFDGNESQRKCLRWVRDNWQSMETTRPDFPRGIQDRLADSWGPLLVIADLAGGKWPTLAREAAIALSASHDNTCLEECLLHDIKFVIQDDEVIFTTELVKRLLAKSDSAWFSIGLNEWTLAERLSGFGIRPKLIRKGNDVKRGYLKAMFADAWKRWK